MDIVQGAGAFEPTRFTDLAQKVKKEWKAKSVGGMEEWNSVALLKADFPIRYLVLHRGVSEAVLENVEQTRGTFEVLWRGASGDRVYRIHRDGSGPIVSRLFRDDQVRGGLFTTSLRRPGGSGKVNLLFNGHEFHTVMADSAWQEVRANIPAHLVRLGMNEVVVAVDGATVETIAEQRIKGQNVEVRDPDIS
jgi:hypothetical protein